jgi:hypothetical protein
MVQWWNDTDRENPDYSNRNLSIKNTHVLALQGRGW